jgi:hypothetical protein
LIKNIKLFRQNINSLKSFDNSKKAVYLYYTKTKINIMRPQNKIEKVSLIIAAIYAIVTFGGAVVILSNI